MCCSTAGATSPLIGSPLALRRLIVEEDTSAVWASMRKMHGCASFPFSVPPELGSPEALEVSRMMRDRRPESRFDKSST